MVRVERTEPNRGAVLAIGMALGLAAGRRQRSTRPKRGDSQGRPIRGAAESEDKIDRAAQRTSPHSAHTPSDASPGHFV